MELQGGEERVFPVQLMTVRRSRSGVVRSIFLSEESSDYGSTVREIFMRNVGRSRIEIEKALKVAELKSQNPKIMRGLALLMFRLSRMDKPSQLDPAAVRKSIFEQARTPAINQEEREKILLAVAREMGTTIHEIDNAMYADNGDNEILASVAEIEPLELSHLYNVEQIETVVLKSEWMEIRTNSHRNRFVRKIRSLGLLYSEKNEENFHILRVSGPVSILEHSERYGFRFALLIRYILKFSDWAIDASVKLKNGKDKDDFRYHLDQSVSEYTGIVDLPTDTLPDFVRGDPEPIGVEPAAFHPDYSVVVGSRPVNIFITTPRYYEEDFQELVNLPGYGVDSELVCVLGKTEKCPPGARCFKESVDWYALRVHLMERSESRPDGGSKRNEGRSKARETLPGKKANEEVNSHLKLLYPDSQAMVDYLDFMGLPPAETLEDAGYKVKWKGLRIMVVES